ncbi:MAG TPA: tetratricopeptide repeat protein [Terriglobales bacterium]|nr:tetratricopeptide repeat protein [Terriglobales bacterium]
MDSGEPIQPDVPPTPASGDRLDSWKEIAAYLKRDVRTVQRWEKKEGLPVHRHLHEKLGAVYAFRSEIDTWWRERSPVLQAEGHDQEVPPHPDGKAATVTRFGRSAWLSLALLVVVLLAAAVWLAPSAVRSRFPRWAARDREPIRSLAVLPLANLSRSSDDVPFVDGIHEALITDLAKMRNVKVISRTTMETYRDSHKTLPEIARELNVDTVVEGSVLRHGSKVRITAKLIRARDEQSLWADDYERETLDSLSLVGTMAQGIAQGIQANLTQEERARLAGRGPASTEALDAYLQGRYHLNQRTLQEVKLGADYFEKAIRIDPAYAPAHAGLADAYILLGAISYDWVEPTKVIPKAEYEARKALELDPSLGEAHVSLANIQLIYYWDFASAERGFRKAEELDPNNATAHHWYARLLTQSGRWDQALTELQHALQYDPKSLPINLGLAWYFYMAQRFDESITQCNHVLELDPTFLQARLVMAMAYDGKGMYAQALEAAQSDPRLRQNPAAFDRIPALHMVLGRTYAHAGRVAEARHKLDRLKALSREHYVPALYLAILAAALGDNNDAFRYLEQGYAERSEGLLYVGVEPGFRDLRRDPRFGDLLRRIGLPSIRLQQR